MAIRRILIVPPAAPGSKGDEGMVRGLMELFAAYDIHILGPEADGDWAAHVGPDAAATRRVGWTAGPLSRCHDAFGDGDLLFMIGADTIDGTCGVAPAMRQLDLMAAACARGVPVYAIFSFRANVMEPILDQLKRLPAVNYLLRDDLSLDRFQQQTGLAARAFPDLSFFFTARSRAEGVQHAQQRIDHMRRDLHPILGVNFAEHSFRSFHDDHDHDQRQAFVTSVMTQLAGAYPQAGFVLLSNDSRSWTNHISDDEFSDIAEDWIQTALGAGRVVKMDRQALYADNIAVLAQLDGLVTGRMHLSYAALRAGTMPIILMGEGRGYSSSDKVRGAFRKHLGSDRGVVADTTRLGATVVELLSEQADIGPRLAAFRDRKDAECRKMGGLVLAEIAALSAIQDTGVMPRAAPGDTGDDAAAKARAGAMARTLWRSQAQFAKDARRQKGALRRAEMQRGVERLALKTALLGKTWMTPQRVEKLNRSLAKRKPAGQAGCLQAALTHAGAGSGHPPKAKATASGTGGSSFAYHALLGLAALSAPFSERRANRFRRSAEKRDPRRRKLAYATLVGTATGEIRDGRERRILVADYRLPRPDVSAGERATVGLVADLCALGFAVTFVPTYLQDNPPYRENLERMGAEVITSKSGYAYGADYIRAHGHKFGVFYFIRVDVAESLLNTARRVAPDARVIFHAPDLYFLRESRAAELKGDAAEVASAATTRVREIAIMQACDHVVLVSPAEIPHLADIVPASKISVVPALYSNVIAAPQGYAARDAIFFLGGFKHRPNVDSVHWFVQHVWPKVRQAMPDVEFHIIGAEAPGDIVALGQQPGVRFIGYVEDLDPVLARYRLAVAPLLYGAGIKGKIAAALGAGVPTVTTSIGAEGMGIVDAVHALVRDTPEEFADAVVALYRDPALWESLAQQGARLVADNFGAAANRAAFLRALERAAALPLDLYADHCRKAAPARLPVADPGVAPEVSIIIPAYDGWHMTSACLNALQHAIRGSGLSVEIILADDNSSDDTRLASAMYPGLTVVRQESNLGFLLNSRAAAAQARGTFLVFLNNDTVVLPNWLVGLVTLARAEAGAAIVGARLLYPDGTIQECGSALLADGLAVSIGRGESRFAPLFCLDREVDYVSGASMLVRRDVWDQVGGFDTRYIPAYCEDSDLAMAVRALGWRVLCAARSQVLHYEHGSYGAEQASAPKALMVANNAKLLQKWRDVLNRDHLPSGSEPLVAAAAAERQPSAAARARRRDGRLNVLYFSPYPSHPDNHGNQATIQAFGRRFRNMGHRVHFVLLEGSMYDAAAVAQMRAAWDSLDILPTQLECKANGKPVPFDGWYQEGTGEAVRMLCQKYDIDVLFCSYVFQSRLLDFVPAHVLKIIDTHDKMGDRYEMLRANGQKVEFFSCSPEDEGRYLRRADIVVARRAEEARYFDSVSGRPTSLVLPHVEESRDLGRTFDALNSVGIVASANRINLHIVQTFLAELSRRYPDGCPFTVQIAGQVSGMLAALAPADRKVFAQPWVRLHGFVDDIASFYRAVDLVVSPVTLGTGINVKTVQAMAFGMPLVTTLVGIKGIETDEPLHRHATLEDLVASLDSIRANPAVLARLAQLSRERYATFLAQADDAASWLFAHVRLAEGRGLASNLVHFSGPDDVVPAALAPGARCSVPASGGSD